jgi:hypothetical protein
VKSSEPELAPLADGNALDLALLARRSLHGDAPRRDAMSFAGVEARIAKRRRQKRVAVATAGVLSVALAALVAVFLRHDRAITYRVVNGAEVDGSRIVAGQGTLVRFSEGSELALATGAETHISALDARGGKVSLDDGKANVKIAKRPGAAWTLGAGPYSVRVTGTAFSLGWSRHDQAFAIAMSSGTVVVSGPLAGAGITLHAGQRLESSLLTGRLVVDEAKAPPPREEPQNPAPSGSPPASSSAPPSPPVSAAPAALAPLHPVDDWREKAAQGRFSDVIAAAEHRGLDATLRSAPLEQLSALADSARYARRTELAKRVLLAERARFPKSSAALDAAFFLGRIAEDRGDNPGHWYYLYLTESPTGTYASQALGRMMMLVHRQYGVASSKPLAVEYLARFPKGAYARSASMIAGDQASSSGR